MFASLGTVEEEHNGNFKVTMAGNAIVFQAPMNTHNATADDVTKIRHFLRESESAVATEDGKHLLLVIDHKEAKIFHTEIKGSTPERIMPYDPTGIKGHVHSAHDFKDHTGGPNMNEYFTHVAKMLGDPEKILIFGSGNGSSNVMGQFTEWLAKHQPKLSEKVVDAVTVDESHLSEGQLLALARQTYGE